MLRFLSALQRAKRAPNRRETYYLRYGVSMIQKGNIAEAEASLLRAENAAPLPPSVASMPETNVPATVEDLQQHISQELALLPR